MGSWEVGGGFPLYLGPRKGELGFAGEFWEMRKPTRPQGPEPGKQAVGKAERKHSHFLAG